MWTDAYIESPVRSALLLRFYYALYVHTTETMTLIIRPTYYWTFALGSHFHWPHTHILVWIELHHLYISMCICSSSWLQTWIMWVCGLLALLALMGIGDEARISRRRLRTLPVLNMVRLKVDWCPRVAGGSIYTRNALAVRELQTYWERSESATNAAWTH